VSGLQVREIPIADTRPLRHTGLRPNEPLAGLIAHEPNASVTPATTGHSERRSPLYKKSAHAIDIPDGI
jgi:hypothetical protein